MPFDKEIPPEFPRVTEITEPKYKRQLCARADYVRLIEAARIRTAPTLVVAQGYIMHPILILNIKSTMKPGNLHQEVLV
jgi:hypothetical protein